MKHLMFIGALVLISACAPERESVDLAIENVTVIDAVNGVRERQRVLIEDAKIHSVTAMSAGGPHALETLDASGQYLIPGLWDMHVHFLYDNDLTDSMADLFLRWGVTSVRDTGGNLDQMVALRKRLQAMPTGAPRLFFSGPLLDGRAVVYDGSPGRPGLGIAVPTPERAEAVVSELQAAGADFIKIYEMVEPAVFDALVAAAEKYRLPIASHVPLTLTADISGPAVGSIEHLRNIELACAENWQELRDQRRATLNAATGPGGQIRADLHARQRFAAIDAYSTRQCEHVLNSLTNTIQVPTLRLNAFALEPAFARADWDQAIDPLPEIVSNRWQAQIDTARDARTGDTRFANWSLRLVRDMHAAGVPIGAGTDSPIALAVPGYSLHSELEMLVAAGLTPLEALGAATVIPAQFFGLAEEGEVASGMRADLVLLDADPIQQITNTKRIARVMLSGQWLD